MFTHSICVHCDFRCITSAVLDIHMKDMHTEITNNIIYSADINAYDDDPPNNLQANKSFKWTSRVNIGNYLETDRACMFDVKEEAITDLDISNNSLKPFYLLTLTI